MTEDTRLPMNKVSAIRGGIGEMLLRSNCIQDRQCDRCDFESECMVRMTLYSRFDRKPDFVTSGDSVGYVLECEMLTWKGIYPKTLEEHSEEIKVYRYSSTQNQKMPLRGIKGELCLEELPEELVPLLLAGEVTHIGKNTSFGFGRYRISER